MPFSGNQHMKKKFYKNNVGFIIFMVLVYLAIMIESCLRCEKILNKCQMIYEGSKEVIFALQKGKEVCYNVPVNWKTVHQAVIDYGGNLNYENKKTGNTYGCRSAHVHDTGNACNGIRCS